MEAQPINVTFGGHQTFSFRYGWLEKGFRAVDRAKGAFGADDAIVRLGVGKNMVDSIKHWCILAQLVESDADETKRSHGHRTTPLGRFLLDVTDGWDPYLEDDASLWLVHWLIVSNPKRCTIWQVIFSHFHKPDFSKTELSDFLKTYLERHRETQVNPNTLARDLDCFLKTYVTTAPETEFTEEGFDCPLAGLGLIRSSPDGRTMHFDVGAKSSIPHAVFYFAYEQFLESSGSGKQTMTIHDCLYSSGSPGQAFKLDENALFDHVEALGEMTGGALLLNDTAGQKQIYQRSPLPATHLLAEYYKQKGAF